MERLTFRIATHDDMPRLLHLEQQVVAAERPFNRSISVENTIYYDINALINEDNAHLIVAEFDSEIVATGYIQIRQSKQSLNHTKHGYLGFMYVEPAYRGQGLNQRLMKQLLAWGKKQGVHDFYLDVYESNQAAIKAYEKVGFSKSMIEMKIKLPD